jgi:hypothetical protein
MVTEFPHRSRDEPVDWSELARADCTVPETLEDVEQLAKSILHRKRDFWIVVLTARRLEAMPAVPAVVVREIVAPPEALVELRLALLSDLRSIGRELLAILGHDE